MLSSENVIYVVLCIIICTICQLALFIIRKHHLDKPIGMQTLLGKVVVIFLRVFSVTTQLLITTSCIALLYGPFRFAIAFPWWFTEVVAILSLYLAFLSLMVTKYMLIYHGTYMADINEDEFMKHLKILLVIVPVLLAIFEVTTLSNPKNLATFQQMYQGTTRSNAGIEVTMMSLMILSFAAMIFTQARIEYDALKVKDEDSGLLKKVVFNSGYAINVTRFAVGLGLILAAIICIQIFSGADNTKWNQLLFTAVMTNIMPVLFICNHPQMKKTAWKIINVKCSQLITSKWLEK